MTAPARAAVAMALVVAILAVAVAIKWASYDPRPAVWHEQPDGINGDGSLEIAVTVEQGWKDDIGQRIVGDVWVKYGGKIHATFRCATGGPATNYLGVAVQSAAGGGALIADPAGACP